MLMLDLTATIQRNTAVGTNGRYQLATIATAVPCQLLPMSASVTLQSGFSLGRGFEAFFDSSADVQTGDMVLVNGNKYIVKFMQNFEVATPGMAHKHAYCQQEVA